jgi:hypothetical protein
MAEENESGASFVRLSVVGGVAAETMADEEADRVHGAPCPKRGMEKNRK